MQDSLNEVSVLSAMITPAVLNSACATPIFSTSTRLARIVDRVRNLMTSIEHLSSSEDVDFSEDRTREFNRQLAIHTRRGKLIQNALTSFYVSLSLFVAATVTIGLRAAFKVWPLWPLWIPNLLGIIGTLFLFYACIILIAETRLAIRSVRSEMEFTLLLREKYQARRAESGQGKSQGDSC